MTPKTYLLLAILALALIGAGAGTYAAFYRNDGETNALLKEQIQLIEDQKAGQDAAEAAEKKFFSGKQVVPSGKPFKPEW
jgi:hypothetical protein